MLQFLPCAVLLASLAAQDPSPKKLDPGVELLRATAGEWVGQLEYRDFGSDKMVRLPARLDSQVGHDDRFVTWDLALNDPGRVVRSTTLAAIEQGPVLVTNEVNGGRIETTRFELTGHDVDGPNAWQLTALSDGLDNGRAARLRHTWRLRDGVLTKTMAVRRDGDAEWFVRNELRLTRATASSAILVGKWKVDLRPTPGAAPYFKTMVIATAADRSVTGTFYDSEITAGRINTDWGSLRFAFTTSDGSNDYHTHVVLRGDRLEGTTHAPGRGLLSFWTAVRAK